MFSFGMQFVACPAPPVTYGMKNKKVCEFFEMY
jgi:hypothetical protein